MSVVVMHRAGNEERDPDHAALPALVAELDADDPEHPDVAIGTEDGWTLSATQFGDVYWENVETGDGGVRRMQALSRDRILELFRAVAQGDIGVVEAQPWRGPS